MKKILPYLFILGFVSGCGPGALDSRGSVQLWINQPDVDLEKTASGLPDLKLEYLPHSRTWSDLLNDPAASADLVFTDLYQPALIHGKPEIWLDISSYQDKFKSPKPSTGLQRVLEWQKLPQFIPTSVHYWVLMGNRKVLQNAGLSQPDSMDELENQFEKLKSQGVVPLALGGAFGWPALGWIGALDVKWNGPEAYWAHFRGRPSGESGDFQNILEVFTRWKERTYIDPQSHSLSWVDALEKVTLGKAAYVYLPASAAARIPNLQDMNFFPLPDGPYAGLEGELGQIRGFLVPALNSTPEPSLALADAYRAKGAFGQTLDGFQVSALSTPLPESSNSLQKIQADLVSRDAVPLPQPDLILTPQAAYNSNLIMTDFLHPKRTITPAELQDLLEAAFREGTQ